MLLHEQTKSSSVSWDYIYSATALGHDFARSLHGKPFMIMEEQSVAGSAPSWPQPQKGQLRMWNHQPSLTGPWE
jgi:hypothetical protein